MGSFTEKARVGAAAVCVGLLACPPVWAQGDDNLELLPCLGRIEIFKPRRADGFLQTL